MKKLLTFLVAAILAISVSVFSQFSALAWSAIPSATDWSLLPGNDVGGTPKPSIVSLNSTGLSVAFNGGEYAPGGDNAGVMYNKPVDLSNFSVTFKVDKAAGNYNLQNTGVDTWISICLLNQKDKYFNTNYAGQSQGIVVLIRPMAGKTRFEINMLTNNWNTASRGAYDVSGNEQGSTFTFATKKNSSGVYDVYINGTKLQFTGDNGLGGNDFIPAFTTLMESSDVYFYMGNSSRTANQSFQYTITNVNNTAIKGSGTTTTTTPTTTKTSSTANANTSAKGSATASAAVSAASGTASAASTVSGASAVSAIDSNTASDVSESTSADSAAASQAKTAQSSKGSPVGIIIGVIVAAAVIAGGVCVYFFVIKKRR